MQGVKVTLDSRVMTMEAARQSEEGVERPGAYVYD